MFKVEFFALRWETALLRYYLLMALPIIGGFTGQWWIGFLALPVFLSVMSGMKITRKAKVTATASRNVEPEGKVVKMTRAEQRKADFPKSA